MPTFPQVNVPLTGSCALDCCEDEGGGVDCDDAAFIACIGANLAEHPECVQYDLDSNSIVDFVDFGIYRQVCPRVYILCADRYIPKEFPLTVDSPCAIYLPAGSELPIEVQMVWTGGYTWESQTPGVDLTIVVDPENCRLSLAFEYGDFNTTGACEIVDAPFDGEEVDVEMPVSDCIEAGSMPIECVGAVVTFFADFS